MLAAALSLSSVYLFARDTDWRAVRGAVLGVQRVWLALSVAMIWLSVVLRALRWGVLTAHLKPISLFRLYNMSIIGILLNSLLPARLGEPARALMLARREGLPFFGVAASVVVERVLDLACVIGLLAAVLLTFPFPDERSLTALRGAGTSLAGLFAGVLGVILVMLCLPETVPRLVERAAAGVSTRLALHARSWTESFVAGLGALRRPRQGSQAVLWTVPLWASVVLSDFFIFPAFGLEATLPAACLLTTAVAVCVALPQAPGFVGVFQLGVSLVLVHALGVDASVAKACAIVLWFVQLFALAVLGLPSLVLEGVALGEIRDQRRGG